MKKTAEMRIKALFAERSIPPMEVIIPILEKMGRGEQELTNQIYDTYVSLAREMKEILELKNRDMKTLAKLWTVLSSFEGLNIQPAELSESRFSFNVSDCPMYHVGKDVSLDVKNRFCDLICTAASKALMDTALSPHKGVCTWDKALVKGARKCTVVFEPMKTA